MVSQIAGKIKEWGRAYRTDALLFLAMVAVATTGFGMGRLSVRWEAPSGVMPNLQTPSITASDPRNGEPASSEAAALFIASKNGSSYYPEDCAAGRRIKPENVVRFASEKEAEQAGYRRAASCP